MSRNRIASKSVAEDMTGVTIEFVDGEALSVTLAGLSDEIITHLALHGLSQKLGDSYSGEQDAAVARAKASGVAERLVNGDWRSVREGGGGGRITDLAQALASALGKTIEEAVAVIGEMDKGQKSGLRKHPKIRAELAQIAAARAAAAAEAAGGEEFDLGSLS